MTANGRAERERLAEAVTRMIEAGPDGDSGLFERLALEIFAFQYANNPVYRQFCDGKRITPSTVARWRDVPAFPTEAFKGNLVASFPLEEAVMGQITSGSTSEARGKVFRDELGRELVLAANRAMTGHWLFPDFASDARCRLLILAPSPKMAPSMGMAIGMEETRLHFGTKDSRFLLGLTGIDVPGLVRGLEEAEDSGVPVALIGSTSAFVYFFGAASKRKLSFRLPPGSRLCDGGGYRGRFGEMTRDHYYEMAADIFGVPENHCVNTLGMAESATNYFDDVLRRSVTEPQAAASAGRRKVPPPWTRITAVSIEDLSPLPPGEVGLLRHYDLANLPTVLGLQTDNLGVTLEGGGFEIIGRAKVADGKVAPLPSELAVGPMGDRGVFRMLERYVNFSIDFKMGRVTGRPPRNAAPAETSSPQCACEELNEELIGRTDEQKS
jgi:hypothetical protein